MVVNEHYPLPPQYALLGYSENVPRINRRAVIEAALAGRNVVVYTPYNSNYSSVDRYCDIIIPATQYLTDLSDLCLSVKGSLKKNDNTPLGEDDNFSLANCTLHSLFKSVNIYLNQVQISSDSNYSHTSMVKHLTRFSNGEIESGGCLIGLRNPKDFNPMKYESTSFTDEIQLANTLLREKGFYYQGKLEIDAGALDSYLINNVEIRIRLQIADNVQIIGCEVGKNFQISIDDLKLHVTHYELRKNASIALEKALTKSPMVYPFKRHVPKSVILARNQTSIQIDSPFHGHIPKKLYIFMTHLDADRKCEFNTFHYSKFGLSRLRISVDNIDAYNINCSEENELYYNTLKSINKGDTLLTKETWGKGSNIIVLDMNTEIGMEESPLNLQLSKRGNMRINLEFGQNNDHNIIVYLLGEFSATLQINYNREITLIEQ